METDKLKIFFEENGFNVHLSKQDNIQCAEIEMWTNGGVDMLIWLAPFTIEEFIDYVDSFDIDEKIDMHRQDSRYKKDFSLSESLIDFNDYLYHLKEIVLKLVDYKPKK